MVDLEPLDGPGDDLAGLGDLDHGLGNMLRFDTERLRVLIERHLQHTGSARARHILDNWETEARKFVKVMPKDYRRALMDLEDASAAQVAAQ